MEHLWKVSMGKVDGTGLSRRGGIYPEEPEGQVRSREEHEVGWRVVSLVSGKESEVYSVLTLSCHCPHRFPRILSLFEILHSVVITDKCLLSNEKAQERKK